MGAAAFLFILLLGEDAFSASGTSFLHTAHFGTPAEVRAALKKGANINVRRDNGSTPLVESVFNKHVDVFFLLLDQGADIHARDRDGATPLLIVALYGKQLERQLEALLDAGAEIDAQADDGCTALIYLAKKSHIHPDPSDAIELLLDRGADPKIQDKTGRTAFEYALHNSGLRDTKALERLRKGS